MNRLSETLLKTGKPVKLFRGLVFEDSHNFAPGSAGELVFKLYKAVHEYYMDLMTYQFQLYSDRPDYAFNLSSLEVFLPENLTRFYLFDKGRALDFSVLHDLSGYKAEDVSGIKFRFDLVPGLNNLDKMARFNVNHDLFSKARKFSVPAGDGSFYSASFAPAWDEAGLLLTSSGISHDMKDMSKLFGLG